MTTTKTPARKIHTSIRVPVTEGEYRAVKAAAKASGYHSVAAWMRDRSATVAGRDRLGAALRAARGEPCMDAGGPGMSALALPGVDPFPSDPKARVKASSAWYTPDEAADAVADACWSARARDGWRILEPAAGHGALLAALFRADPHSRARFTAVELDARSAEVLRTTTPAHVDVECCDYLTRQAPEEPYDLCLMNPPYERGLDSAFLGKAMDESLRVVALVRLALLESQRSHDRIWSRVESGEWSLIQLCPFVARPVFMPGGGESDVGKTAFMLVKLSRVPREPDSESRETGVRWIR